MAKKKSVPAKSKTDRSSTPKKLEQIGWTTLTLKSSNPFVSDKKFLHVMFIYSDYTVENEFGHFTEDLSKTWELLLLEFKMSNKAGGSK